VANDLARQVLGQRAAWAARTTPGLCGRLSGLGLGRLLAGGLLKVFQRQLQLSDLALQLLRGGPPKRSR
jgi:hypothetical protein